MSTRTRVAPHAAGRASDPPTPAQLKDLFAQIEAGSPNVTKDRMQGFLRGKLVDPTTLVQGLPAPAPNHVLDELSARFWKIIPDHADRAIELVRPFCAPDIDLELNRYVGEDRFGRLYGGEGANVGTFRRCMNAIESIPTFKQGFDAKLIIVGQDTNRSPYWSSQGFVVEARSADEAINKIPHLEVTLVKFSQALFGQTIASIRQTNPRMVNGIADALEPNSLDGLCGHLIKRFDKTGAISYRQINREYVDTLADHVIDLLRTAIILLVVGHDEMVDTIKAMLAVQRSGHPFLYASQGVVYFLARPA